MFEDFSQNYNINLDFFFMYVEIIASVLRNDNLSPELGSYFITTEHFFKNFWLFFKDNFILYNNFFHDLGYSLEKLDNFYVELGHEDDFSAWFLWFVQDMQKLYSTLDIIKVRFLHSFCTVFAQNFYEPDLIFLCLGEKYTRMDFRRKKS